MYGREVLANAGMKVRGGGEAQYEEKPIFVGTYHISIIGVHMIWLLTAG